MKTAIEPIDIASPRFKADPFPFYARLRAEEPVYRVTLPDKQQVWLVTRYDDVSLVLKDERFAKDRFRILSGDQLAKQPWVPKMFRPLGRNMLDVDPPDHTRLRALVQLVFSPRLVEGMRGKIETLAADLLDRVLRRGQMDLIRDYALPIPTLVIADMLGIPAADRHKIHRWSSTLLSSSASSHGLLRAIPSAWLMMRYVSKLIRSRRKEHRDDLTSALVEAHSAGDALSDDELMSMIFLLVIAGHETTVNLIGNGMLALFEHPDQLERLRNDPSLIRSAVEELLRYGAPVETATERFASEDVEIGGVTIRKGEMVFAAIASANRDERQFPNPDVLDITREPNRHLAFGQGIHFCLGAALARLECQIAINHLLARTSDLRLKVASDKLAWRGGLVLRSLKALPVAFSAAREPVGVA